MAFSKAKLYDEEDQIIAGFFKAFSHPARIKIIRKLCKDGPCRVDELAKSHPVSGPTVSDHLEILRETQLVRYLEKYPYTFYSIDLENLKVAQKYFNSFFESLSIDIMEPVLILKDLD